MLWKTKPNRLSNFLKMIDNLVVKGLCHGSPVQFGEFFQLLALTCYGTYNVSEENACKWQNQSFVTNKYVSRPLYLNLQTKQINFETVQPNSFSKIPIAIHGNLLQFGPSAPSFVFAVLFKPFVTVLSGYFYVSLKLEARSWRLILAKFRDTAPLTIFFLIL